MRAGSRLSGHADPLVRHLRPSEVGGLAELERASWPRSLQASADKIRHRLGLGHDCIVAEVGNTLTCAACYVLTSQSPFEETAFPTDFASFSSLPRTEPVMSSYAYSLCVRPEWRGHPTVFRVLDRLLEASRAAGARYLVADGRCPSFNGVAEQGPDRVARNPDFRSSIVRWQETGIRPSDQALIADPVLRFYKRYLRCRFLHLAPDFIPEDLASGGFRVIFAVDLGARHG